jgi:hypothetical protein
MTATKKPNNRKPTNHLVGWKRAFSRLYHGPVVLEEDAIRMDREYDCLQGANYKDYLSDDDRCALPMLVKGVLLTEEEDIRNKFNRSRLSKAFDKVLARYGTWSRDQDMMLDRQSERDLRSSKLGSCMQVMIERPLIPQIGQVERSSNLLAPSGIRSPERFRQSKRQCKETDRALADENEVCEQEQSQACLNVAQNGGADVLCQQVHRLDARGMPELAEAKSTSTESANTEADKVGRPASLTGSDVDD